MFGKRSKTQIARLNVPGKVISFFFVPIFQLTHRLLWHYNCQKTGKLMYDEKDVISSNDWQWPKSGGECSK